MQKYFKIVNPQGHRGMIYTQDGIYTAPDFDSHTKCGNGIHFAQKDIFAFLNYGTELWEVEPLTEVIKINGWGTAEKFKSESVKMTKIGLWKDYIPHIVEECGADIHVDKDYVLRYSAENGHLDVVRYLVSQGADIHICDDYALRYSAENGHLDVVKYLVSQGADVHADDWVLIYSRSEVREYLQSVINKENK